MSPLIKMQLDYSQFWDYGGSIVCIVGVIVLFFYPLHGIGLLLFGGFLVYRALAHMIIATTMDASEKLAEIAAHFDEAQRKGPFPETV